MRLSFVVCPAFHGATLLALLLNNHSQLSALGDMNPSREFEQFCACRQNVSQCDFWQTVVSRLQTERFAHLKTLLPTLPWPLANYRIEGRAFPVSRNATLNRASGRLAATALDSILPLVWRSGKRPLSEYVGTYCSFYELVLDLHGTAMVIDGSKSTRKAAIFAEELGRAGEVKVIHLVRDPRGFAASGRRNSSETDLRAAAWLWSDLHHRMERLQGVAPYRRLRYEDLCVQPESEMRAVFDFLEVGAESVVSAPKYERKHHLMGNDMLFDFKGDITLDERWRDHLTGAEQSDVLRYAGEMAERLGYA